MSPVKIALAGVGKIALDQHLPAIENDPDVELVALISRSIKQQQEILEQYAGAAAYESLDDLLASDLQVDAVALCVPPGPRYEMATKALASGLDVLLEKPPGRGVAEVTSLADSARRLGRTLYASWHSRHAEQVATAAAWLEDKKPLALTIHWREDVRVWHPGQEWVWEAGGMGVFDPAINAFSIATLLLPDGFYFTQAQLDVPVNRQQPVSAAIQGALAGASSGPVDIHLDWLKTGDPQWEIQIETAEGTLELKEGGAHAYVDGDCIDGAASPGEYAGVYAHFVKLIKHNRMDVDSRPLTLVADALLMAERREVDAFEW